MFFVGNYIIQTIIITFRIYTCIACWPYIKNYKITQIYFDEEKTFKTNIIV